MAISAVCGGLRNKPVRRQYQGLAAVTHLCQRAPHLTSSHRVDSSCRLVQKDDRRVAYECYARA